MREDGGSDTVRNETHGGRVARAARTAHVQTRVRLRSGGSVANKRQNTRRYTHTQHTHHTAGTRARTHQLRTTKARK